MSVKTHVPLNDNVEGRYGSWVKQSIDLIAPKNLFFIGGRGTAKSTDIQAERTQDVSYDMPRAQFAMVSDTYFNAMDKIVPGIIEGWRERKGWIEDVHYVTDKRPPEHFKRPYKPVVQYKHTISLFNGCIFKLGSLDRIANLAGDSFQHVFGDEVKFFNPDKLKKLMPARRGFPEVSGSTYYRGTTFTTDMPNVVEGEFDWILERADLMDKDQIILALRCGCVVSDIRKEYYEAFNKGDYKKANLHKKNLERWVERWARARKDLSFFYMVSSFANADILQVGYFKDVLESDGIEAFKSSILSLKPDVKKGEKFYGNFGEHHLYDDGINASYYDKFNLTDKVKDSSQALKYVDHKGKLEAGLDFGDMCSLVIGQPRGNYYYLLKNMFTLAPESSKELAKKFIDFFEDHQYKVLDLYYDRSGNQYQKQGRDWAGEIKDHIEKYDGVSTGWRVNLMSRNQANITHDQEFRFMKGFMGEHWNRMPKLKIDKFQCGQLISSIRLAKIKMKYTSSGGSILNKDKTSEKLPLSKLPMYSTNMSDAFKYLMYRKSYVKIANRSSTQTFSDPIIIGAE
mgnify:CR=1 FL=1|tara:strand:- start:2544 stop:4250 length:1707 start_codon:yes stop_codon:yes gene_type:complete